jgi:hypothetical protein
MQMTEITAHLEAFVERHENQDQRQLTSAWSDKQSLNDLSRGAES